MKHIAKINKYFKECFEKASFFDSARITTDIPSDVTDNIRKLIPDELHVLINANQYIIKGSIGVGKATKTPWIAIMDKDITTTTREGVYIVFLFSSNYSNVYLTFNQGTTVPDQFGLRLNSKVIIDNRNKIRDLLRINNPNLKVDSKLDVNDEKYKEAAIYYALWDVNNDNQCKDLLNLYLNVYQQYKNSVMSKNQNIVIKNVQDRLPLPLQTIYYGTPGSGKSHKVKELVENVDKNFVVRTTFHPDSDYASFVGCYKPVMKCVVNVDIDDKIYNKEQLITKILEFKATGISYVYHRFGAKYWRSLNKLSVQDLKDIIKKNDPNTDADNQYTELSKGMKVGEYLSNENVKKEISYEFTPQAFTKAYVKAWKTREPVYLIIEEINRGNCAQIFGDLFQLLDRKDGVSEYPIDADNDLKDYLEKELGIGHAGIANGKLRLPSNLNILATMNTSDQSLFPMDSAFKRRWDWECVPVDYENVDSAKFVINIDGKDYLWHDFLENVNARIKKATDSEDKQMGNFFITGNVTENQFVNKVMFYLWNDICKEEFGSLNNFFRNYIDEKKSETEEFSFNDLFTSDKKKLLSKFMEYIEVKSVADVHPEKSEEESE